MDEYTYKNVIIDPTSEDAKNCIGKRVYFADSPSECLNYANIRDDFHNDILIEIEQNINYPFSIRNQDELYGCIILDKTDTKSDYMPFESADEFIHAYENYFKTAKSAPTKSIDHTLHKDERILIRYTGDGIYSYQRTTKICSNGRITGYSVENKLLNYGVIWIRPRNSCIGRNVKQMVFKINDRGIEVGDDSNNTIPISWNELFDDYEFINGTPCGKLRE